MFKGRLAEIELAVLCCAHVLLVSFKQIGLAVIYLVALLWAIGHPWTFESDKFISIGMTTLLLGAHVGANLLAFLREGKIVLAPVLRVELASEPLLKLEVERVALDMQCTAPGEIAVALSPGSFGAGFASGAVTLPAVAFGVWNVLQLRCQIARGLIGHRESLWLFGRTQQLLAEGFRAQGQFESIAQRMRHRLIHWMAMRAGLARVTARLHRDTECDRRIAGLYGRAITEEWIRSASQMEEVLPSYLVYFVQKPLVRQLRLPLGESYCAFAGFITSAIRRGPSTPAPPGAKTYLEARLEALQQLPDRGEVADFRAAASLLPDLNQLEERVLQSEANLPGKPIERIAVADYVERVVLAEMREACEENRHLVEGLTVDDLPDATARIPDLAKLYKPPAGLFPTHSDKEQRVQQILVGHLVQQLMKVGWLFGYDENGCLLLTKGKIASFDPFLTVAQLANGQMSAETFRGLLESAAGA